MRALLPLVLLACGGEPGSPVDDPTTSDSTAWVPYDGDGDGVRDELDCAPDDPAIHLGAAEVWYDGVDANCDGLSDYDADADGSDAQAWGGGDCDDEDGERFAGAERVCGNGVDDDCDAQFDCDLRGDVTVEQTAAGSYFGEEISNAGDLTVLGDVDEPLPRQVEGDAPRCGHQVGLTTYAPPWWLRGSGHACSSREGRRLRKRSP